MKEPINHPKTPAAFIGKSYNKHPQWYNLPLRLSKEQRHRPETALYDFFQSFHLNEVREILWAWLTEVVSSPHSISQDHHERNNHIFFYEKLEEVIEAAFVVNKRYRKMIARLERHKRKKDVSEQTLV